MGEPSGSKRAKGEKKKPIHFLAASKSFFNLVIIPTHWFARVLLNIHQTDAGRYCSQSYCRVPTGRKSPESILPASSPSSQRQQSFPLFRRFLSLLILPQWQWLVLYSFCFVFLVIFIRLGVSAYSFGQLALISLGEKILMFLRILGFQEVCFPSLFEIGLR